MLSMAQRTNLNQLRMALDLAETEFWRHITLTRGGPDVIAEFEGEDGVVTRYEDLSAYLDDMGRVVIRLRDPVGLTPVPIARRETTKVGA